MKASYEMSNLYLSKYYGKSKIKNYPVKKIQKPHTLPSVILGISKLENCGAKVFLIHSHKASLGEIIQKK